MSHAENKVTEPDGAAPALCSGGLLSALRALSLDMHQRSDRPCPTCRPITLLLGEPFGCYAYQAKRGLRSDIILPQSADNTNAQPSAESRGGTH